MDRFQIGEIIKKIVRMVIVASAGLVAIGTILTYVIASAYSFISADDFTLWYSVDLYRDGGWLIKGAWGYTVSMYLTWQGIFYSCFIQSLLSPLNGFGDVQLKIMMVVITLAYFGTLFLMIVQFMRYVLSQYRYIYIMPVYAVLIVIVMGFKAWPEIFYWYSGGASYNIPLETLYAAIAIWLIGIKKQSNKFYFVAAIVVFMAAGGTLEISGMGCYLALIFLFSRIFNKKIDKRDFFVFGASFAGCMVNALAPGNFERHNVIDATGLHIGEALLNSMQVVNVRVERLFYNPYVLTLLLLVVVAGWFAGEHMELKKSKIIIGILLLFWPYITVFPVVLGYSSIDIPNRCEFILYNVLAMTGVVIAFYIGAYMNLLLRKIRVIKIGFAVIVILISLKRIYDYSPNLLIVQTMIQLEYNEIQTYTQTCKELYESIWLSEEADVLIYEEDIPDTLNYYRRFSLSEDETNWINYCVAAYYGKQSVKVVPCITEEE